MNNKNFILFCKNYLVISPNDHVFCSELYRHAIASGHAFGLTELKFSQFMYHQFPNITREKMPKGNNGKHFMAYIGLKFYIV